MKNLDFFDLFSSVTADCRFCDLPSSYHWNTQIKWLYYYRVVDAGDNNYEIYVSMRSLFDEDFHLIYIVYLSVKSSFIHVSDIQYSPQSISLMKFSPDELKKSAPFLLGKFRNYRVFLGKLSHAAKVIHNDIFVVR